MWSKSDLHTQDVQEAKFALFCSVSSDWGMIQCTINIVPVWALIQEPQDLWKYKYN